MYVSYHIAGSYCSAIGTESPVLPLFPDEYR